MIRNLVTMGLSEIEKSVVKATYDDELAPKEKHFLIECSRDYDLLSFFDRRLAMAKWNIVFKTLIVLHRLTIEGHDRVMKDLAQNHHTFNLHTFFDSGINTQDHQAFIAKYADYLAQKVYVFKLLGTSIERRPPTESKEWARKLAGTDLVKAVPAISQQFDKLLQCAPYQGDIAMSQIPIAALTLLVKDAFRLYSTLTVLMLGVVDHYLELDAKQTQLILTICKNFRRQNISFKKWTTALAELGFAHDKLFPELIPIPDALFELLQDHINLKSGKPPAPSAGAIAASASAPGKAKATAAYAAVAAGKKTLPPKKKHAPVEDDEEEEEDGEDEEKDPMDSDSEEEAPVRKVTKKTAALAVTKKPTPAPAPVVAKKPKQPKPQVEEDEEEEEEEPAPAPVPVKKASKKAPPPPQPEPEEEEEEEEEDDEEERARKERKRAKKEKKAKKEAKKAKKKKEQESEEEEVEEEEEEPEPVKPVKKSKKAAKAAPLEDGEVDLVSMMSAQSAAAAAAAVPSYSMPVSSNVFQPYAASATAAQPTAYGAFPGQQPGYGQPQPYGGVPYGAPSNAAALAQLQPLSSATSQRGRGSGSYNPGEENTTALGGIHDPQAHAPGSNGGGGDPFGDLAPPDLGPRGKKQAK